MSDRRRVDACRRTSTHVDQCCATCKALQGIARHCKGSFNKLSAPASLPHVVIARCVLRAVCFRSSLEPLRTALSRLAQASFLMFATSSGVLFAIFLNTAGGLFFQGGTGGTYSDCNIRATARFLFWCVPVCERQDAPCWREPHRPCLICFFVDPKEGVGVRKSQMQR